MFARILEFVPKLEKRKEFVWVFNNKLLPILKKQDGFLDAQLLFQINSEKALATSFWTERTYAEPYEREWFPKVQEIMEPYLSTPITVKHFVVESAVGKYSGKVSAA
jgi:hypothetical protein